MARLPLDDAKAAAWRWIEDAPGALISGAVLVAPDVFSSTIGADWQRRLILDVLVGNCASIGGSFCSGVGWFERMGAGCHTGFDGVTYAELVAWHIPAGATAPARSEP